ncbi:MAG TPA: bifunctional DNA-binding transcriptional regulator/O6-methylguanine-DNA methyltransferase Ada [Candidatus Polarisedimenticolia bacterium]|nr:bifunctional DNA-binding transcriptional regulator/O6-methylguanine-DNA methyltransferase Ada [Candidatus Polarisedimenticolia bacterium]
MGNRAKPRKGSDQRRNRGSFWRAVASRDRRADGAFVYAVRSTGIYCRPSCPSRKPSREQVVFFRLPEAAEQQGFRPCRRCRPHTVPSGDPRVEAVARVCREIDARTLADPAADAGAETPLTLAVLGRSAGMSPHQLQRAFRRVMGITPRQYADTQRMRRLKSRLKKGDNVTTALYDAGYGSASRLYERAPVHLGMTPATYGRGGAGMRIRYAIVNSPLGRLLVGATDHGISAVYLGESETGLRAALRNEYPNAELLYDSAGGTHPAAGLGRWVARILAHLRGQEPHLDLPTDVQATAFQRRVWEELRRIPYGATKTYSEVARAIGRPAAVRAVARACATNPVSVVVPCHRVVREGGGLAGYRWGIDRKRALLEKEAAARKLKQRS